MKPAASNGAATPIRRGQQPDLLPHSDDAERAVLGAMLISRASIDTAADRLMPEDFHRPAHSYIWSAIIDLWADDNTVDAVLVCERLNRAGLLEAVGGATTVAALTTEAPATALNGRIEDHCQAIAELAKRRTVIRAATEAVEAARHGGDIEQAVTGLVDSLTQDHGTSSGGWDPLSDTEIDELLDRPEGWDAPTLMQVTNGPCLLYSGKVHSFAGESGSAKSWLLLLACVQAIQNDQTVLYLDFEDSGGGIYQRLVDLGVPRTQAKAQLDYVGPREAINPARWRRLSMRIQRRSYALCVLDGVTEAMTTHNLDLLDNADIARFLHLLPRRIAALGPAVAMIDHVSKNPDGRRGAIGGQHKKAGIDGAAYLVEALEIFGRGKTGRSRVIVDGKDRSGYVNAAATKGGTVAYMELRSWPDRGVTYRLTAPTEGETWEPTELMERVSKLLEEHPSGLNKNSIETMVKGKAEVIRTALDVLISKGYVKVERGARGSMVHTSARQYRKPID